MNIFQNMQTRTKLQLSFAIISVVVAVLGIMSIRSTGEMSNMIHGMYVGRLQPAVDLGEISGNLANIRIGALRIMNEPDTAKRQEFFNNALNDEKEIEKLIEKYGATSLVPEEKKVFEEFKPAYKAYKESRLKTYSFALEGKFDESKQNAATDAGPKFKIVDEKIKRLIAIQGEVGKQLDKEGADNAAYLRNISIIGMIIAISISFGLGLILAKMIANPLQKGVQLAEAIADGDLTQKIDSSMTNRDDEVGQLMKSLDRMTNHLNKFVGSVVASSNSIASASEELSASATQIAKGSQSQTEKATTVAASAEEMSATVIEVAKNASGASESAKESNKLAQKGKTTVERTVEGMNGIAQSVEESASVITQLGNRSNEIGEIIKVIDDIADQTNLLALNAAIEAARAGEHGRGFAVVADEVRKLAEKTTKATKEIGGMISTIQNETGKAVTSMGEVTKEVSEEVKQAKDAGDALNEIAVNVDKLTGLIQQIAVASEEQSAATDTISRDIQDIANTTKETSTSSTQIADASNDLSKLATELQGMLAKFKVRSS
ncbi:MAG: methyl-accepting chemotaxis protein [Nitrospinae bacterium]|nr:methyl-accepting chemotaxis protein [Nitrospinota bacterium]